MKKHFYGILCLLGLLSCQKSLDSIVASNENIKFNVAGIKQQPTRAGNDHIDDIKNSTKGFGVFVSTGELQASGNIADNRIMQWNGSTWYDQTEMDGGFPMLWTENQSLNIYAYYPYMKTEPFYAKPPLINGKMSLDQSSEEKLKLNDLIVARHLKQTSNPINLVFQHAFVKLRFHINSNGNGLVENAYVHTDYITYNYNLSTQTIISPAHHIADVKMYCYNQTEEEATAEAIMPGLLLKARSPYFYVKTVKNGVARQYAFNLTEDIPITPNYIYNFNVTLLDSEKNDNIINISNVTITKWTENLLPNILIPSNN